MGTTILVFAVYVLIILLLAILYLTRYRRNYWFRVLVDIKPTPFGKKTYDCVKKYTVKNKEGIASYSLYGDYEKYYHTLIKNVSSVKEYLPKWCVRVYTAVDIPKKMLKELRDNEAEVFIMGPKKPLGYEGSLWRFLAAEENVPFVSLDADDEFTKNIAEDIIKWQGSGKAFCSLTEHKFALPMTAGTWGANPGTIPDIKEKMDKYYETWFGFDEAFLKKEVWPVMNKKGFWRTRRAKRYDILFVILLFIILFLMFWSLYLVYKNEKKAKQVK